MVLKGDEAKYIKPVAIAIAVAIALWYFKKTLSKILGFADEEKKEQADENKRRQLEIDKEQAIAKNPPTKTDSEWSSIADQIHEDLKYSAISNDEEDAFYQVQRVKNDADFWVLYEKFGKRQRYQFMFPIGTELDLPGFINYFLEPKKVAVINDNYRRKGMKFRF